MVKKVVGRYYGKQTQKKWKKIGDSLLYGCGAIGATGLIGFDQLKEMITPVGLRIIIVAFLVLGFAGKFLSNFFKDDEK
jgi:hypothetical protein